MAITAIIRKLMARKNKKTGEVMKRKVVYEDVPDLGESIELLEQFYNVK